MGILIGLIYVVISIGIGLALTHFNPLLFGIGVSLAIIGISFLLFILYWWLHLNNRRWRFRTSDDKTVWIPYFNSPNKAPVLWRIQSQKEGLFYEIDIGKEKKIIAVLFDCGYTSETPIKSRIWFHRKDGGFSFPYGSRNPYIENKEGESANLVRLTKPIRAQKIRMEIIKPDIIDGIAHPWRVEAIYVRVKMLFGLKEHTIGKFFLDKL